MAMVFALLVVSMLVLNDRLIGDALRRKSDSAAMPRNTGARCGVGGGDGARRPARRRDPRAR